MSRGIKLRDMAMNSIRLEYSKKTVFLLFLAFIFLLMPFSLLWASASPDIVISNERLSVSAENIPLHTILQQVAEKANLSIVVHGSLNQSVSISFTGLTVEEGLKRLLSRSNFSFLYQKEKSSDGSERVVLSKATIFAKDASASVLRFNPPPEKAVAVVASTPEPIASAQDNALSRQPVESPPVLSEESATRVGRGIFVKSDRVTIGRLTPAEIYWQLAGRTTGLRLGLSGGPDLRTEAANQPAMEGFRITGISEGSVYEKMGLMPGDVIQDIDGKRITKHEQVTEAIERFLSVSGPNMIRIEVEREDVIEPIYVEMR